jgi:hypothetical protein
VPLLVFVLDEPRDTVDTSEETVHMDSFDAFLTGPRSVGKEGVREGRGGAFDLFRGGGLGGRTGVDLFGVGGGTGAGWLLSCLAVVDATLKMGGLLTVCTRGGIPGRCPDGGGGGGFFFSVVAWSYVYAGRLAGAGTCTCSILLGAKVSTARRRRLSQAKGVASRGSRRD